MNLRGLLRRRAPDPTTVEPMGGDHRLDVTADLFDWPPTVYIPDRFIRLGAYLTDFTPERRRVLAESETPGGWPAWLAQHYEQEEYWPYLKEMCVEVFTTLDAGISAERSLVEIEARGSHYNDDLESEE
jgi:hypothetical protein